MAVASLPAFDPRSVESLRRAAQSGDQRTAVRGAAQQFEALMLQQLLKAMRATIPENTLFESGERKFWQELADQQLASDLAKSGGVGLAKALERQWLPQERQPSDQALPSAATREDIASVDDREELAPVVDRSFRRSESGITASETEQSPAPVTERSWVVAAGTLQPAVGEGKGVASAEPTAQATLTSAGSKPQPFAAWALIDRTGVSDLSDAMPERAQQHRIERFVRQLLPAAQEASAALGVPPHFLLAHAALETGWGSAMLRRADGTPSNNLFNIKAGRNWEGETVQVRTTEYRHGRPQSEVARFRVYPDLNAAFQDYVRLIATSERYAAVRAAKTPEQFAQALARGGYATDPLYAQKLVRVIKNPRFQTVLAQITGTTIA